MRALFFSNFASLPVAFGSNSSNTFAQNIYIDNIKIFTDQILTVNS